MLFTPEMSILLDKDRQRSRRHMESEQRDRHIRRLANLAKTQTMWVALGSMAVSLPDGSLANRSIVFAPDGAIRATYDKIHMFDVALGGGDNWNESSAYTAGRCVVSVPDTVVGHLGLSVCYDVRFPALFDALGRRRCDVLAIPAAFTRSTGAAHWHLLLRARAVEASAYVVAAAQVGQHADGRQTYGHSLVVDPWGEVVLDMGGHATGLGFADIALDYVEEVRRKLPSLANKAAIGA